MLAQVENQIDQIAADPKVTKGAEIIAKALPILDMVIATTGLLLGKKIVTVLKDLRTLLKEVQKKKLFDLNK